VLTIEVTQPRETKRIIETILACLSGVEEERTALSANDSVA
jgi:hypothetical protein